MKVAATVLLFLSSTLSRGLASPVLERASSVIDDTIVLNYALTLEHLENAFYTQALARFGYAAFIAAGFSAKDRARFVQIKKHEATHVEFLEKALGNKATKACSYKFPYTDVKSFVGLAMALEGVGVSAYLGAARFITNKDYLTAAASVLTTESRHAAWISAVLGKQAAWGGALDTPLGINQVYTLAASMIVSCPSSNPPLPVKAFPSLTLDMKGRDAVAGMAATVSFQSVDPRAKKDLYVAFYSGLSTTFVPLSVSGKVVVPAHLAGAGQAYAVVTTANGRVDDSTTIAGPAILEFPDYTNRLSLFNL